MAHKVPIFDEPRTDMDAMVTVRQIGRSTLMRVGAHNFIRGHDLLQFDVLCDDRLARILIILTPADLYTVEIGHMHRRTFEWTSIAIHREIDAEQLRSTIETLYQKAFA